MTNAHSPAAAGAIRTRSLAWAARAEKEARTTPLSRVSKVTKMNSQTAQAMTKTMQQRTRPH